MFRLIDLNLITTAKIQENVTIFKVLSFLNRWQVATLYSQKVLWREHLNT